MPSPRLQDLHTLHLAALRSSPPSTLKAAGTRALIAWQKATEQIDALSITARALALELRAIGEQRNALRSVRSEIVQDLIRAHGNTLIVIDGITYDFGESGGTYYLRPRKKRPAAGGGYRSHSVKHPPSKKPTRTPRKPRKVRKRS